MIALASTSVHKADELGRLLGCPVAPIDGYDAPIEDGATFLANATIKARAGRVQAPSATLVLADDSGLVVDALDGAPGILSARFGGPGLDDQGRVAHLLAELLGVESRVAAFVCVLVALGPDGVLQHAEGRVEGAIALAPRGSSGFGYDPVFVPAGHDRAVGEMSAAEKDALSHRGRAARLLARTIGL